MLELAPAPVAVIACLAHAEALDGLALNGAYPCRVAPDELLLVGPASAREELEQAACARLAARDARGVVVDQSDGWAAWRLAGEERDEAFARLSAVPLPRARPAFVQGAVAGLQAKVIAAPECTYLLVVSTVGHHLHGRLLTACRDLEPAAGAPAEFALVGAGRAPVSAGAAQ